MANAKRCDRCNRFYNHYEEKKPGFKMVKISQTSSNYKKNVDLCPKCLEELEDWFDYKYLTKVVQPTDND